MWMRTWIISFLVCSLSLPCLAQELDAHTTYRLPEGTRITVLGETYQAYTLSEYTALLLMDSDLLFYTEAYAQHLQELQTYAELTTDLATALSAANAQIDLLRQERERLTEQWTEENRLRLEAENGLGFGNWVAWSLVGLEAVVVIMLINMLVLGGA